jgi:hypothetical protein
VTRSGQAAPGQSRHVACVVVELSSKDRTCLTQIGDSESGQELPLALQMNAEEVIPLRVAGE